MVANNTQRVITYLYCSFYFDRMVRVYEGNALQMRLEKSTSGVRISLRSQKLKYMKVLIISFIVCVIFICFLIHEIYQHRKEYKIESKFSINNGEELEYYFILKQKSNNHVFKIQVSQEAYDLYDLDDYIIIL